MPTACLMRISAASHPQGSSPGPSLAQEWSRASTIWLRPSSAVLDQSPAVHGGRRVVFLASDDEDAAAEIGVLAENLGFAPIRLGGLSEGGLLVPARGNSWGQLIFQDLIKFDG